MSIVYIVSDILGCTFPDLPWGIDRVFKYIGFYTVGTYIHIHHADDVVRGKSWVTAIAVILLGLNFSLLFIGLTTGIMWFVMALVGVAAVGMIAFVINKNPVLQYFGRISLVILCVHGPVYKVIVKLLSIVVRMTTDAVRGKFILSIIIVALTLAVCAAVYEVLIEQLRGWWGRSQELEKQTRGDRFDEKYR